MVSFDGGSASKVDNVTALPSRHKMADMCYYGNVMTTTRWCLCVFYIFNNTVIDWACFFLMNSVFLTEDSIVRVLEVTRQ